jgi:hypothetical protein
VHRNQSPFVINGELDDLSKVFKRSKERAKEEDFAKIKKLLQELCRNVESRIGMPCVDLVSEAIVREGYLVEEIVNKADRKGVT